jgi:hypothetical protein
MIVFVEMMDTVQIFTVQQAILLLAIACCTIVSGGFAGYTNIVYSRLAPIDFADAVYN